MRDRLIIVFSFPITFSSEKPKCLNNSGAGADAPKLSIPTTTPFRPAYPLQTLAIEASITMIFSMSCGITDALYSSDCCSNISTQGIETTLMEYPSDWNAFEALTAYWTSEPVAMMIASGCECSSPIKT